MSSAQTCDQDKMYQEDSDDIAKGYKASQRGSRVPFVRHGQALADLLNEGADKSTQLLFLPFQPARPTECQVGTGPRVPVPRDRPTSGNYEQEASRLVRRKLTPHKLIEIPAEVGRGGRVRLLCEARTAMARSFRASFFGLRWRYCVPSTRQQPEGSVYEI